MGKVFEALYGSNSSKDQEPSHDELVTQASDNAESVNIQSDSRRELDNLVTGLPEGFSGNAKWRRDMRKVAINLMVQVDPDEQGGKCVMFTSTAPRAGTSTVTAQIAKIFAAEYAKHRVLVVDVKTASNTGANTLDKALDEGCQISEIIDKCEPQGVSRIQVYAPDDQVRSTKVAHYMREFFAQAKEYFDWILIDMPPIGATPLADTIGRSVDGVSLVISTVGTTRVPALNAVDEDMNQLGINLIGVILNFRKYPIPSGLLKYL
ncbi:MAG: hypothetical protein ACPGMR_14265 [Pontibacterium sp.]